VISYKTIHCRGFVLCVGSGLQGGTLTQPNAGHGFAMQYVYVYKGHGEISNGAMSDPLPSQELTDISKYMGNEVSFKVLGDPTLWVAINPTPDTDRFDALLLRNGESTMVNGGENRKYIVCLEGSIGCNDKQLQALMYAPVRSNSTVSVTVPQGATALVLNVR
jgi:hypothetical protein